MSTILTFSIVGGILAAAAAVALSEADKGAMGAARTDATPATTRVLAWFRRTGTAIGAGLAGALTWLRDRRPRREPGSRSPSAGVAREPDRAASGPKADGSAGGGSERDQAVAVLGEPVGEVVPSARPTLGQRLQSFVGLIVLIVLLGVGTALVVGVLIAAIGDVLDGVVG